MANGNTSKSNGSVFSGRLDEFRLVELLQMVGLQPNTGALHLHQDNGRTGLIYFDAGALVSCSELDTEALTLGHVLQQLGYASATQIGHAFQQQTQDPLGKRIGERLVDLGIIDQDRLMYALKMQALWTARELGLWREGMYEFHPGERLAPDSASPRIDSTHAIMEMLRYEHEWESLEPYLRDGMRTRLMMAAQAPLDHQLLFDPRVWLIISKVNAQQTVRRIATTLRLPELDVARMVEPLIQQGLLIPVGAAGGPGLPEEAARLSMHNFDLFTLLIGMEQDWLKKKTPMNQLIALAEFINVTMRSLEESCHLTGLTLAPDTLNMILEREGLVGVENYRFRVEHNRIDTDEFTAFCKQVFDGARGAIGASKSFYDRCSDILERALGAAFESINARIASPLERAQNQEAWEALFLTFRGEQTPAG